MTTAAPFFLAVPAWGVIITRSRLWLDRSAAQTVEGVWRANLEPGQGGPIPRAQAKRELAELRAALVTMGWTT